MTDRFLTHEEEAVLHPECLAKYQKAKRYCSNENAGGYDGWSKGHDLLKELGWKIKTRSVGHRTFQSLVRPENIDHLI